MNNFNFLCEQFATILKGKSKIDQGACSVSFHRNFRVLVQGKPSMSVIPAGVGFESLDQNGNALNLGEIAVLQEEIPSFMQSIVQQGIIVSALHNHWLYTDPLIMYIHVQSVEPPLNFAKKMANSFSFLSSYPIADK
ncbi:methyltransferase [Bacillus pseudomycoides]|nr:methyltransferase [Bacillus pseudomycoides]